MSRRTPHAAARQPSAAAPPTRSRPADAGPGSGTGKGAALAGPLEFMQTLWALVHAVERTSKRMTSTVGVTGPQRLVLRVLGLSPRLSAGALAATLHVHPSTLTGVLERLVAQGLVARITDPVDRRRAILSLTPEGTRINAMRRGTVEAAVTVALGGTTSRDRTIAIRVLQRLTTQLHRDAG